MHIMFALILLGLTLIYPYVGAIISIFIFFATGLFGLRVVLTKIGLIDTHLGIIIVFVALNVPLEQLKVDIVDSKAFWSAEKYHQDFAVKNPLKYKFYRTSCGRDNRLKKVWGEYK